MWGMGENSDVKEFCKWLYFNEYVTLRFHLNIGFLRRQIELGSL